MWLNEIFECDELRENSILGNDDDYIIRNLNDPFYEPQPGFIRDNHCPDFHRKNTEIDTGELNSLNEEIINNTSKENSVDNPFVQTNINNNNKKYFIKSNIQISI